MLKFLFLRFFLNTFIFLVLLSNVNDLLHAEAKPNVEIENQLPIDRFQNLKMAFFLDGRVLQLQYRN